MVIGGKKGVFWVGRAGRVDGDGRVLFPRALRKLEASIYRIFGFGLEEDDLSQYRIYSISLII